MKKFLFILVTSVALCQIGSYGPISTYTGWLLTSFEADDVGNGAPQPNGPGDLRIFQSPDLSNYYYTKTLWSYNCAAFLRDPSIFKSSVTGTTKYYMVHSVAGNTSTSCTPTLKVIGITSSTDGLTWANQTQLDMTSQISGVVIAAAPEWFVDPNSSGLSAIHVFFQATLTTCCSAFQLYEMHPTANDFATNAASWSTPIILTVTSETNLIDVFPIYRSDTNLYYLWFRNGNVPGYLNYASSSTLTGTYTNVETDSNWGGLFVPGTFSSEGPCLRQTVSGSPGTWAIIFDGDTSYTEGNLYISYSTDGWATWTSPSAINAPTNVRHGTVISFP
jgi:hypothetical protein